MGSVRWPTYAPFSEEEVVPLDDCLRQVRLSQVAADSLGGWGDKQFCGSLGTHAASAVGVQGQRSWQDPLFGDGPTVHRAGERRVHISRVRIATNWTKSVELAGANDIRTNIGIRRVATIWRANADLLCLASSKGDIGTAP